MKIAVSVLTALMFFPLFVRPSAADDRGHRRYERERHPGWHGDIRRFHEHDLKLWRGGRWYHGPHAGRHGWWWIVGGVWYFYPAPVYPYPDPYRPPVVIVPSAPPAPATQYWFYCNNPPGYYPYVPRCGSDWQRVPANPPPSGYSSPAPAAVPPAPAPGR